MNLLEKITNQRVMIIAEIGNNHNGNFSRAIELIDLANKAGVDAVKFQMRNLNLVYREKSLKKTGEDLSTEYVIDLLNKYELTIEEHQKLFHYCKSKNIIYFCTPWDAGSLDTLESMGVPMYKVASADLTNLPLIKKIASTGKPLILSTGMSSVQEVKAVVDLLRSTKAFFALLHCNSTYPAPFQDINLKWINKLKNIHSLVGYSGHERGTSISIASVALGARVIERHFTLDRNMEGPDHAASLEYEELVRLVDGVREVELGLGDGESRIISQGEMINRENLAKSLVASKDLKIGHIVSEGDIDIKSPGMGLSPCHFDALLGKAISRDMCKEDYFFESDLSNDRIFASEYKFKRPWGVPVRYHDFAQYNNDCKPDMFEFHLSYSDMDLDPKEYLRGTYQQNFVVHAPELFAGSHLMDLTSENELYRLESLLQTQRVIDITRGLKEFFPRTSRPMIVANIGGFTMDGFHDRSKVESYYSKFKKSISELDLKGVELLPQTMAPFPWHFGGQRYQNLFVHPEEIVHWCANLNLRICFDISHTFLTCENFNYDFYEFARMVAPYTAHIHIGDAKGLNGEGLQIGKGDIDFAKISHILDEFCPTASFIPEIWQGHKNHGEGFWYALSKLQKYL